MRRLLSLAAVVSTLWFPLMGGVLLVPTAALANAEDVAEALVSKSCKQFVKITEEGNREYAWFYLTNNGSQYVGVTIKKTWIYEGRRKKETARIRLYPGQRREVFSFPRNQKPTCKIVQCNAE